MPSLQPERRDQGVAGTRDVKQGRPGEVAGQLVTDVMPRVVMVAAGAAHTSAITDRGVVLSWCSAHPQTGACEVGGLLSGKQAIDISAGGAPLPIGVDEPACP